MKSIRKSIALFTLLTAALTHPSMAQVANELVGVSPGSAGRGDTGVSVTLMLDTDDPAAPPAGAIPDSVTIGSITGSSLSHPDQYTITASFDIPEGESLGTRDIEVLFNPPEGALTFSCSGCFTITEAAVSAPVITEQPSDKSIPPGATASFSIEATGTAPLYYQWQKDLADVSSATQSYLVVSSAQESDQGAYRCIVANTYGAVTSLTAQLSVSSNAVTTAADEASDPEYDSGFSDGLNGGYGFGAWALTGSGFFTGSSSGNAAGSGDIDTGGRSWGLWSTSGVTEAVRPISTALTPGQVLDVSLDNGYINSGRSIGIGLQNASGTTLAELYFSGGEDRYTANDANGARRSPVPFTGDGFTVEFELIDTSSYLARITGSQGDEDYYYGSLNPAADQAVQQLRFWNYEAGQGSDYDFFVNSLSIYSGTILPGSTVMDFPVVDTHQDSYYSATAVITPPSPGGSFAGQDAQYTGNAPRYILGADGLTVYDTVTRLTWMRSPDLNDDGVIDISDKPTWSTIQGLPASLNSTNFGGYSDWRLPSIKELYSLMDFRGTDPSGFEGSDTSGLTPFMDARYFDFAYGDTNQGERIIDVQYASSNLYVSSTANDGGGTLFGVNFADGRIKGYGLYPPMGDKTFLVLLCRGNTAYGSNQFTDNGDGTISDLATGLTWQEFDSSTGMTWEQALAYAESLDLGGYRDWRLPNIKELQGLLDYTRSPDTAASAAIDPIFACSAITNEAGQLDFPAFWSSTTHGSWSGSAMWGSYASFGRAMGYLDSTWSDVHGAGAQRSDPKYDDGTDYSNGHGPQGDAIRIYNFVRCVRGGAEPVSGDSDGDGISDWFEYNYTTNITAMDASGDLDGDGFSNGSEEGAGTSPVSALSSLAIDEAAQASASEMLVSWPAVLGKTYRIERAEDLASGIFETAASGIAATPPMNQFTDTVTQASSVFYRVSVE